jgi:hypothetical protein
MSLAPCMPCVPIASCAVLPWDCPLQKTIATPGRGILAMDESNATCGKRLDSIGVENTEDNRRAYRELLLSAPGLGKYVSGAILFEETLFQNTKSGKSMVAVLGEQGIVPGIKASSWEQHGGACDHAGHVRRGRLALIGIWAAALKGLQQIAAGSDHASLV